MTPVNDAPVAHTDSGFSTIEGGSFEIDPSALLNNDVDVDGDPLEVVSVISSANTEVSITAEGLILVAPRPYFFGSGFFDYVMSDGNGGFSTARVNFEVAPINDPPALARRSFRRPTPASRSARTIRSSSISTSCLPTTSSVTATR